MYDVLIIGAGVVGTAIARRLSRYQLKIAILEAENDVAMGSSKANSAIVHGGYAEANAKLKGRVCYQGRRQYAQLDKELNFGFRETGSLVITMDEADLPRLEAIKENGEKNGLPDLEILEHDEILAIEPNVNPDVKYALYCKGAGVCSPYEMTVALAENAIHNGAELFLNSAVTGIDVADDGTFVVHTDGADFTSRFVVNAAGLYSDKVDQMVNEPTFTITPRSGEYILLGRGTGHVLNTVVFAMPTKMGKGILVAPTTHHNVFVGPTSLDMEDNMDGRHDVGVRVGALRETYASAQKSIPSVSARDQITSFAGLRAHWVEHDFYINPAKNNDHFINLIGIESPGLAASPAIAEYVENMVLDIMGEKPAEKADWNPSRKAPVFFRTMSPEERAELIAKDPAYSRIVCRCETVTEGEIRDAIRAPAGAVDLDGVKRRTRAGMGRCQGGFCGSRVMEILSEELDKPIAEIKKFGRGSDIIYERTK